MSIEDIILSKDRRGVSQLRDKLPPNFCQEAARFILGSKGPIIFLTGFYMTLKHRYETDGPIGSVILGQALEKLEYKVYYVTDGCAQMMRDLINCRPDQVIEFPVTDHDSSKKLAKDIIDDLRPDLAISVERCALSKDKKYLNMRGGDMSEYTAKLDYLFMGVDRTVGIGDGGNEIGMGLLYDAVAEASDPVLTRTPSTIPATHLVIASVSNWGAYGLAGYLSILSNRYLLPALGEEQALIRRWIDMGGVDGITGESAYTVDTFPLEDNASIFTDIHREVTGAGVSS